MPITHPIGRSAQPRTRKKCGPVLLVLGFLAVCAAIFELYFRN